MKLSKIILYSDAKGRGVKPDACVEVSQRLTIMRDGHIWFTGYDYGDGFNSETKNSWKTKNTQTILRMHFQELIYMELILSL